MQGATRTALAVTLLFSPMLPQPQAQHASSGRTYSVDCSADAGPPSASSSTANDSSNPPVVLHSLDEVNALQLESHDTVLFRRGTVCHGSLHPQGNGFVIDASGIGALPRIEAGPTDEAAFRLFNQEHISIASLDLRGGTTFGVNISGDHGTMHSISLRNLTISNVRGPLKRKESGLVVIAPMSSDATFEDVHLDRIRAFDSTQWSGIFIEGGSVNHPAVDATVTRSIVHDVQGDGIVLFKAKNSRIDHSVAWHTGMQHQQTIGTPNAIWTWQCADCVVEDNEAFLTDSPGIDGGAFDIDWGNTGNTVRRNFGHDTEGYCISIFGANVPTKDSVVADNLCVNNGRSPRLAQRQGAILLMTWNGGSIDGLTLGGNRIDWTPDGDTPAIQTGSGLHATGINFERNLIHTTASTVINRSIPLKAANNHYFLEGANEADLAAVRRQLLDSHETDSSVVLESSKDSLADPTSRATGWRLVARAPTHALAGAPDLAGLFISLSVSALQFSHSGLQVSLSGDGAILQTADDWSLPLDGVQLNRQERAQNQPFSLKLIAPGGRVARSWTGTPSPIDLGLALRRALGAPDYGRLKVVPVTATD